jgi:hypothetical protein
VAGLAGIVEQQWPASHASIGVCSARRTTLLDWHHGSLASRRATPAGQRKQTKIITNKMNSR